MMKKGFTLIEMVVVIAILSVLAAFVIIQINPLLQFQKANDSRRKSDLAQIQRALEAYYQDNGKYPNSSDGKINTGNGIVDWGSNWSPYMSSVPKDPDSKKNYAYWSSGQIYKLYATLDRASDLQACSASPNPCPNVPSDLSQCDVGCNYGVSSPNSSP